MQGIDLISPLGYFGMWRETVTWVLGPLPAVRKPKVCNRSCADCMEALLSNLPVLNDPV